MNISRQYFPIAAARTGVNKGRLFATLVFLLALVIPLQVNALGSHSSWVGDEGQQYETGKHVFHQKLKCAECPYGDVDLTIQDAGNLLAELQFDGKIGRTLEIFERDALRHYLKKRYSLN